MTYPRRCVPVPRIDVWQAFLERDVLLACKSLLTPDGMLAINFGCRSASLRETVLSDLRAVFPVVHELPVEGMINTILFCMPDSRTGAITPDNVAKGAAAVAASACSSWDNSLNFTSQLAPLRINGVWVMGVVCKRVPMARASLGVRARWPRAATTWLQARRRSKQRRKQRLPHARHARTADAARSGERHCGTVRTEPYRQATY